MDHGQTDAVGPVCPSAPACVSTILRALLASSARCRWGQFLVGCDGKLFAVGGGSCDPESCGEAYDPATNEWRALPAFRSGPRWGSSCAAATQHQLVVIGGMDGGGRFLSSMECLSIGDVGGWTPGPALQVGRAGHCTVFIDGHIYCAGGRSANGPLRSVERLRHGHIDRGHGHEEEVRRPGFEGPKRVPSPLGNNFRTRECSPHKPLPACSGDRCRICAWPGRRRRR
jgi:hypothetical protein